MLPTLNNMHITVWGHPFAHKIFQKTNTSYTCAYLGVGNSFSESFAYVLNEWSLTNSIVKLRTIVPHWGVRDLPDHNYRDHERMVLYGRSKRNPL